MSVFLQNTKKTTRSSLCVAQNGLIYLWFQQFNYSHASYKAPGPGYINAWALKSGKCAIGTHLQIIFNDCIQEKIFPTILKDAHITPYFKRGDVSVLTNYRPISVTPTLTKVFERFSLNQLVKYLQKYARAKNNSVSNLESRLLMLRFT